MLSPDNDPETMKLRFKRVHADATPPARAHRSAGYDLASIETVDLPPKGRHPFRTGIVLIIPPGHYGRVAPRSGLASRAGIDTMAGVIDEDYRGEVKALLVNLSDVPVRIEKGDRVAQLILERISTPDTEEVDDLAPYATDRGTGGFGSTGVAGSPPAAAAAAAAPGQYAVEVTREKMPGIGTAVLYMPTERK